jgi:putative oxidoreductase
MYCNVSSEWALTIVRVLLGTIFIAHGSQKVFGWFGGSGLEGFTAWLINTNVPPMIAYLAPFFELIGGTLLVLGFCAELGALLIIPVMIAAIYLVHWQNGFFSQHGGYEYALCLLVLAIAILIGGPGKLALWDCTSAYKAKIFKNNQ